jgi:hypothetical protein
MAVKHKERPPYVEPLPFPEAKMRHEMRYEEKKRAKMQNANQCTIKPNVDLVKELIELEPPSNNIIKLEKEGMAKGKDFGKPVLPCSFGGVSYYGLCNLGSVINGIPYFLYEEIQNDICPSEIQNTYMTIMLVERTMIIPYGILTNVYIFFWSSHVSH